MRRNFAAAGRVYALPLLACMSACSNLPPAQQATIKQVLTVACNIDGVVVPIAQPIVATIGPAGTTVAGVDGLLVHPAVVAACKAYNGTPVAVAPASPVGIAWPDGATKPPT
jgi:hypothetical protein